LDSAAALAIAIQEGYRAYALTVNYGQRHKIELAAARRVAEALGAVEHLILDLDLRAVGGSALTDNIAVPKNRKESEMFTSIPSTYVPARNTILLALALSWAETLNAEAIFIGVNAVDYSGYPDCRPEFIRAFEQTANLATKAGAEGRKFTIKTPLINLKKSEIIRLGLKLGVDFSLTHSCYDPSPEGWACGACDSCRLRRKGFQEAGVPDPTKYMAFK